MSHEHETLSADAAAAAPGEEARPEVLPDFLARAARILAGDVRPDDYLPVPDSVRREVDEYLASVEREIGGPVTPSGRQQVLNDATYYFHYAAETTISKKTDHGVLVLADRDEQFWPVRQLMDRYDGWRGFTFHGPITE